MAGPPPLFRPVCARLAPVVERRGRRSQPGGRRPVRRAGNVVEADALAEVDRGRVAAMLAADAELEVGANEAAALDGDLHQVADPLLVERDERVLLEDSLGQVSVQEPGRVVAADAKGS